MARASAIELPGHIVSQTLQAPALLFPETANAHSKAHRQAVFWERPLQAPACSPTCSQTAHKDSAGVM